MCLDNLRKLHGMDASAKLSAGIVTNNASLYTSTYTLNTIWSTEFWIPELITRNDTFNRKQLIDFVAAIGYT